MKIIWAFGWAPKPTPESQSAHGDRALQTSIKMQTVCRPTASKVAVSRRVQRTCAVKPVAALNVQKAVASLAVVGSIAALVAAPVSQRALLRVFASRSSQLSRDNRADGGGPYGLGSEGAGISR